MSKQTLLESLRGRLADCSTNELEQIDGVVRLLERARAPVVDFTALFDLSDERWDEEPTHPHVQVVLS